MKKINIDELKRATAGLARAAALLALVGLLGGCQPLLDLFEAIKWLILIMAATWGVIYGALWVGYFVTWLIAWRRRSIPTAVLVAQALALFLWHGLGLVVTHPPTWFLVGIAAPVAALIAALVAFILHDEPPKDPDNPF